MSKTATIETTAGHAAAGLPGAEWDLVSFLENTDSYLNIVGGSLIGLLGLAVVIWAAVLIAKKFFGNAQSQQESWVKIIVMLIIGGALLWGGLALFVSLAEGGNKTIEELGGGCILLSGRFGIGG